MGGRIRRALPASTRNQLWLTGLFLALLALFTMTGARAFLAWPMYESFQPCPLVRFSGARAHVGGRGGGRWICVSPRRWR